MSLIGMSLVGMSPGIGRAVLWAVAVGVAIQAVAFGIAAVVPARNRMAGRGVGILLRFVSLGVFAWAARDLLGLPLAPALFTLAGFFFITTLLEPLLLKC